MAQHSFGPGCFPDCAVNVDGSGFLILREGDPRHAGAVVVYGWTGVSDHLHGLHEVFREALPPGSPCFPKVYLYGLLWIAYHDGTRGHLRCLSNGAHGELVPCENNEPMVFGHGFIAWQGAAGDGWPVQLMDLRRGIVEPAHSRGHGTGLAYIADRVITVDENRMSVPGLVNPVRAGALIVGEDPDPNNRDNLSAKWQYGDVTGRLWQTQPCITPRCAAAGPYVAVTAWGQGGADVRLFAGTLADLVAASSASPVPVPQPIPEPQPMPDVDVPDLSRFVSDFLAPRLKRLESEAETRAHSFEQVNALANALWINDKRVGLLEKLGGDRVKDRAADVLLYRISEHEAQVIDVVSDAEGHDGAPSPSWSVKDIRPIGQWKPPFPVSGEEPAPQPQPRTHAYDGGDNDTGECDVIVAGMKCNQPPDAPIHQVTAPPDPPNNEPIPGDVTLAMLLAEVRALRAEFGRVFR